MKFCPEGIPKEADKGDGERGMAKMNVSLEQTRDFCTFIGERRTPLPQSRQFIEHVRFLGLP